jgi:antirestriction protein ArdC
MTSPLEPLMADLIARIERGVPPWRQAGVACADPGLPLRPDGQPFTGSRGRSKGAALSEGLCRLQRRAADRLPLAFAAPEIGPAVRVAAGNALLDAIPAKIELGGAACYSRARDVICPPVSEAFDTVDDNQATLGHEAVHDAGRLTMPRHARSPSPRAPSIGIVVTEAK